MTDLEIILKALKLLKIEYEVMHRPMMAWPTPLDFTDTIEIKKIEESEILFKKGSLVKVIT